MKKIISFIMCLTMFLMPILTGCGAGGDAEETNVTAEVEVVRYPMTISLWIPTNENTTPEAIKLVEAELNKYTTAKYDTQIELNAISEDEYEKAIEDKLISIDDEKKAQAQAELEAKQEAVNDI